MRYNTVPKTPEENKIAKPMDDKSLVETSKAVHFEAA